MFSYFVLSPCSLSASNLGLIIGCVIAALFLIVAGIAGTWVYNSKSRSECLGWEVAVWLEGCIFFWSLPSGERLRGDPWSGLPCSLPTPSVRALHEHLGSSPLSQGSSRVSSQSQALGVLSWKSSQMMDTPDLPFSEYHGKRHLRVLLGTEGDEGGPVEILELQLPLALVTVSSCKGSWELLFSNI